MRKMFLLTTFLAIGCSSDTDNKAVEKKKATQNKFKINQGDVKPVLANSEVPSPKKMMKILKDNGLSSDLSTFIE